jgi:hypothetical protein
MEEQDRSADRRLHRYFDGDLSAEEREALEREIAADASGVLGRKLTALGDVRTLVRGAVEQPLAEADSAAMWAAIESGAGLSTTKAEPAAASTETKRPALRLVPGSGGADVQDAKRELAPAPQATPIEDPATRRRRRLGVGIGLLALAAAALLAFLRPGDPPRETIASTDEVPPPVVDAVDPPDSMRTEVLAVDFGTNVGTIFAVEGNAGQRYAVVWLDDAVKIDEGAASPDEQAPD